MPPADQIKSDERLLRILVYGLPKARKTAWALKCAEYGFNVVYLEGDDQGGLAISQIKKEAHSRVQIIPLAMRPDKTVFAGFVTRLLKSGSAFTWDEQAKQVQAFFPDAEHSHFRINASLFTPNDVLVLDGWKALAESSLFEFADDRELDLSDPDATKSSKGDDKKRDSYGFMSNFLNWILARLHILPCHLIVIGHATTYEKRDKKTQEIISQRTQPISSSGPHAEKLASEFTEVLFFERISSDVVRIDTGGDRDRDGGSRLFAPKRHNWDDFGPDKFFNVLKWKPTGAPCAAVQWYAPGQPVPVGMMGSVATPQATNGGMHAGPAQQSAPVIANEGGLAARIAAMKSS